MITIFSFTRKYLVVMGAMLLTLGCANQAKESSATSTNDTSRAAAKSGADQYTVLEFQENSTGLTEDGRRQLRELQRKLAGSNLEVEEVEVLAWADREYPVKGAKATESEIEIAQKRANAIENYFKDDLKADFEIEKHNMAQRPGVISRIFRTDDYETKNAFESTGAAPVRDTDAQDLMGSKASKAVVLVRIDKKTN